MEIIKDNLSVRFKFMSPLPGYAVRGPRGIMGNMLDYNIILSGFKLLSYCDRATSPVTVHWLFCAWCLLCCTFVYICLCPNIRSHIVPFCRYTYHGTCCPVDGSFTNTEEKEKMTQGLKDWICSWMGMYVSLKDFFFALFTPPPLHVTQILTCHY